MKLGDAGCRHVLPTDPHHLSSCWRSYSRTRTRGRTRWGSSLPTRDIPTQEIFSPCIYCHPRVICGNIRGDRAEPQGVPNCTSLIPWETPLGIVDTDASFGSSLDLDEDEVSHQAQENSLKCRSRSSNTGSRGKDRPYPDGDQAIGEHASSRDTDRGISGSGRTDIRIVASSDFSHYVRKKWQEKTTSTRSPHSSTLTWRSSTAGSGPGGEACGYGPIAAMCLACRELGATTGRLLRMPPAVM
jgi:hypothetical protein